jgi:hypothetical protein
MYSIWQKIGWVIYWAMFSQTPPFTLLNDYYIYIDLTVRIKIQSDMYPRKWVINFHSQLFCGSKTINNLKLNLIILLNNALPRIAFHICWDKPRCINKQRTVAFKHILIKELSCQTLQDFFSFILCTQIYTHAQNKLQIIAKQWLGSMLWSQFWAIFPNFRRTLCRFSLRPILGSIFALTFSFWVKKPPIFSSIFSANIFLKS